MWLPKKFSIKDHGFACSVFNYSLIVKSYTRTQMADKNNLPLLLCRPKEPCFMVKGEGDGALFDVPMNFLTDRYKDIVDDIRARSGKSDRIPVSDKYPLPDLKDISKLGRERGFSVWIPLHKNYAGKLISIFMSKLNIF